MPPSGFNRKSINGLLEFVKANYIIAQKTYNDNLQKGEDEALQVASKELKERVQKISNLFQINEDGINGLVIFVTECYSDLRKELESGYDKHGREVREGNAITKELRQIDEYLEKFSI